MYRLTISGMIYIISSFVTVEQAENKQGITDNSCIDLSFIEMIRDTSHIFNFKQEKKDESVDKSIKVNQTASSSDSRDVSSVSSRQKHFRQANKKTVVGETSGRESQTERSEERKEETEERLKYLVSTKGIKKQLIESVEQLKTIAEGSIKITSGHRHWGGKKHRKGEAVDISYDETFIYWLISEAGQNWLKESDLSFFVEDNKKSTKNTLPSVFLPYWRHIPWATGKHIHLCTN